MKLPKFFRPFRNRLALFFLLCGTLGALLLFPTKNRQLTSQPIPPPSKISKTPEAPPAAPIPDFYTKDFPRDPAMESELQLLRSRERLGKQEEAAIYRTVRAASQELGMPEALLWCLLFQESRLNHLVGFKQTAFAKGIGQFSIFAITEINRHLSRYTPDNIKMIERVLGKDIRPISSLEAELNTMGSYYYIPTGVAASAAYLNNRYHQLRRVLERRKIPYRKDVLWLYAALAYNKGSRSVIALWNEAQAEHGSMAVEQLVSDFSSFRRYTSNKQNLFEALNHIWPEDTARRYSAELGTHLQKIQRCSVDVKSTEKGSL